MVDGKIPVRYCSKAILYLAGRSGAQVKVNQENNGVQQQEELASQQVQTLIQESEEAILRPT